MKIIESEYFPVFKWYQKLQSFCWRCFVFNSANNKDIKMQLQINAKANPMMLTLSAEKRTKKNGFNYMIFSCFNYAICSCSITWFVLVLITWFVLGSITWFVLLLNYRICSCFNYMICSCFETRGIGKFRGCFSPGTFTASRSSHLTWTGNCYIDFWKPELFVLFF